MPNNNIQLLIELGVSKNSRDNINNYINSLKNLDTVKIDLEVNGLTSTNKTLNETNKAFKEANTEATKLQRAMDNMGGSVKVSGFAKLQEEVGKGIKSIEDLEAKVKGMNGTLTFNYKTVDNEKLLKSITATLKDADGIVRNYTFRPNVDGGGVIRSLDEIKESVKNVNFKDFDVQLSKVKQLYEDLKIQGRLSYETLDDYGKKLNAITTIRSVSELEKLKDELLEFESLTNTVGGFKKIKENLEIDTNKMISDLEQLRDIKGINTDALDSQIGKVKDLASSFVTTEQQADDVAVALKKMKQEVSGFISSSKELSAYNEAFDKLNNKIDKFKLQGSLSSDKASYFTNQLDSINKTKDAVKDLEREIDRVANSTSVSVKKDNAIETVRMEVNNLIERVDLLKRKLGGNISVSGLSNVESLIKDISNATINTVDEITPLMSKISQANKAISQLGSDATNMRQYNDELSKASKLIKELELIGNVDGKQIDKFKNQLGDFKTVFVKTDDVKTAFNELTKNVNISETAVKEFNRTLTGKDKVVSLDVIREQINKIAEEFDISTSKTGMFFNKLNNSQVAVKPLTDLKDLTAKINDELDNSGKKLGIEKTLDGLINRLEKLRSQAEKTKNMYENAYDVASYKKLTEQFNDAEKNINNLKNNNNVSFLNVKDTDINKLTQELDRATIASQRFNAQTTEAVRSQTGFINSLKTAFEKFPVWMVASTVFYGVTNGIRDLTTKVIELDSALVNLQRVANADQYEFDTVIQRANENILELSGNMNDYLTLVNEYARTGKTIDESFELANTTTALQNVSEIDAKEAVDALTASMIAFNIEAEDSIRIGDMLNEVK